jgi:hypothetical protein
MRILATIHPPETTEAILACVGLSVRAPPLAPARRDDGFERSRCRSERRYFVL